MPGAKSPLIKQITEVAIKQRRSTKHHNWLPFSMLLPADKRFGFSIMACVAFCKHSISLLGKNNVSSLIDITSKRKTIHFLAVPAPLEHVLRLGWLSTTESNMSTAKKSTRILELDALRAIAALNLLLFHFTFVFPNKYGFDEALGFSFPFGKYGVQLFFMLSGFVNAMTLLKKRQPKEFIAARFIRIFPTYWAVLLLNLILLSSFSMFGIQVAFDSTLANASVMPTLFGYEAWEPVTWTLQVEVLFYFILMTLFIGGALKNVFRTGMLLCCISLFAVPLLHQWQAIAPENAVVQVCGFLSDLFILEYLPLFVIGMLLHEIRSKRSGIVLNSLGILFAGSVFHSIDKLDHNPIATVLLLTMLCLSAYGKLPILRLKPFVFVSSISYALYLFHNNLGCLVIRWLHDAGMSPILSVGLAFILTIVLATAVTRWSEQPISAFLRKKWKQFSMLQSKSDRLLQKAV